MVDKNVDVQVFTGTPRDEEKDNGELDEDIVTRWHPYGQVYCQVWG